MSYVFLATAHDCHDPGLVVYTHVPLSPITGHKAVMLGGWGGNSGPSAK